MIFIRNMIMFVVFILFSNSLYAQHTLRGKVSDELGTLPGVNVFVSNENDRVLFGVITNDRGEYFLTIPASSLGGKLKLNFSFIGYKTKMVAFSNQKVLDINLDSDIEQLDEVIVSGKALNLGSMGIPYEDQGSSTERISLDDMADMAVTSVDEMLQGRMANVDLISNSGDPGSGMSIRIRGTSSLSASAEPLIVIDGIPQTLDISDDFDFATADGDDFGSLVSISPSDIESIEVLKDAAATAIWGSRGGNGVLVITTKRGTIGKTRFTISEKINFNFEPKPLERLDGLQYVTVMQEAIFNRGYDNSIGDEANKFVDGQIVFNQNYIYNDEFNQNTNWVDLITRIGSSSETNFSMSGGGERALYRFSLGYLTENGTTIGADFKRLNARLNVNYRFSDRLRVDAGISFSNGMKGAPFQDPRAHSLTKMSNMSPYVINDDGTQSDIYFTPEKTLQGNWKEGKKFNPVAMVNESLKNNLNRTTNINFAINYKILNALTYIGELGINIGNIEEEGFLPYSATGISRVDTKDNYNLATLKTSEKLSLNINNKLIYNWRIDDANKIIATVLLQTNDLKNNNVILSSYGNASSSMSFPITGITSDENANKLKSGTTESREIGAVGSLHYNYKSRYMLTFNYRYEGNSRMSQDNRWLGFPSVAATWRISSEKFLESQESWLDDFSLRASWGKSGNSPQGSYPYVGMYTVQGNYGDLSSVTPSSLQLSDLEWEILTQENIGVDLSLFERRVNVTFDYYKKITDNLLQRNVAIQSTTGFTNVAYLNSGVMENKGWEFRINARDVLTVNDFKVSLNFNIAQNMNKLIELPDNINYMKYPDIIKNFDYAVTVTEGHPMGAFYGFNYLGVYKDKDATFLRDSQGNYITDMTGNPVTMLHNTSLVKPGDAQYRDINEDGAIDRHDIVYLGHGMPDLTGGAGVTIQYKNLRLNAFFNARIGFDIINQARMQAEAMYNYDNQSTAVLERWRHPGDVTSIPRALLGKGYNTLGSDRFVEDGTFLRLQQLTLNYTLPKFLLSKVGFTRASVFVTGYNLFTWTNYSGLDPEVSIKGGVYGGMGVDNALTPRPRKVAIGINLEF